ncbi:MAG: hypothetical protein IPJ81_14235 [Chitinophagaceae bacterium]|nr:hypothetical protein [Chitinophagaceae bacterium]
MNKNLFFLFFCTIFVGSGVFGQQKSISSLKSDRKGIGPFSILYPDILPLNTIRPDFYKHFPNSITIIRPDYYTQNFGFFCKKELQLEKIIAVPFKFRVGSLQYCNWMEGKK